MLISLLFFFLKKKKKTSCHVINVTKLLLKKNWDNPTIEGWSPTTRSHFFFTPLVWSNGTLPFTDTIAELGIKNEPLEMLQEFSAY